MQQDDDLFSRFMRSIARFIGDPKRGTFKIKDGEALELTLNDCIKKDSPEDSQKIILPREEVQEFFDRFQNAAAQSLWCPTAQGYETAINIDGPVSRRLRNSSLMQAPLQINMPEKRISFRLGECSLEYALFILYSFCKMQMEAREEGAKRALRPLLSRFHRPFYQSPVKVSADATWKDIIQHSIQLPSLLISQLDGQEITQDEAQELSLSFEFKFMFCYGASIRTYDNPYDYFSFVPIRPSQRVNRAFDTPPRRKYDKDVVDFYRLALSTRDAYLKYLSFYHALEFYFAKSFRKGIAKMLRDTIGSVDFSLQDEALYSLAKEIGDKWGGKRDEGYGNERTELSYVLEEYIDDIDRLRDRIRELDESALDYYRNYDVPFAASSSKLNWSDSERLIRCLTNRIYQTRNALIHSKEEKGADNRYHPFSDELSLRREVPLIQAVAEIVIDNAGEPYVPTSC